MGNEIARVVSMIEEDEDSIYRLSTGETIAAALLFNRMEWLPSEYRHPLDAIDRLGENWTRMTMEFHRQQRR